MGLLQSFLIDTEVSVHIKTQLSTISEQRVNIKLKKNEKKKKYVYMWQKKMTTKLISAKTFFAMNMKLGMNLL